MTQEEESKHMSERIEAVTGLWWCTVSHHMTRTKPVMYNGRKQCQSCVDQIKARKRKR